MRYLLDSDAVISLMKGDPALLNLLKRRRPSDFGVPAIVAHEFFYGAYKGRRVLENLARIDGLQFEIVAFDREDARRAGEVRAALSALGTPIGPYDVLIAGQALARSLVLITHNLREFRRVAGLRVEDWTEAEQG